jgi:hypothetical protein
VRNNRPQGSEAYVECCSTPAATFGCATWSSNARPPPRNATGSALTLHDTDCLLNGSVVGTCTTKVNHRRVVAYETVTPFGACCFMNPNK